jgi:dinuclear metal center YbgI/SA1388 family protein
MVKIIEIGQVLERLAPLALQEDYDNAGLLLGNPEDEVVTCLICIDITEEVVQEAAGLGAGLIISHHPLIFGDLKRLTGQTPRERIILAALQSGISVYAIHTNLDNIDQGVSYALSGKLGLKNLSVLRAGKGMLRKLVTFCPGGHAPAVREAIFKAGAGHIGNYSQCSFNAEGVGSFKGDEASNPFVGEAGKLHFEPETRIETVFPSYLEREVVRALLAAHPYEEVAYDIYKLENEFSKAGMGMVGELEKEMGETEFLQKLKDTLKVPCIRHSRLWGRSVRKIAVCGGSGSFLIQDAIRSGADFFVTADIKYHQFQQAGETMVIADAGHFESEQFTCELIGDQLKKNFPNFAVLISETPVNPVNYF